MIVVFLPHFQFQLSEVDEITPGNGTKNKSIKKGEWNYLIPHTFFDGFVFSKVLSKHNFCRC